MIGLSVAQAIIAVPMSFSALLLAFALCACKVADARQVPEATTRRARPAVERRQCARRRALITRRW